MVIKIKFNIYNEKTSKGFRDFEEILNKPAVKTK